MVKSGPRPLVAGNWKMNGTTAMLKEPRLLAGMLRGVGVEGRGDDARGAALASYLLFEAPYTRELMALGVADTMNRRADVVSFFGW